MNDKKLISSLIIIIASLLMEKGNNFDMRGLRKKILNHDNEECVDLIDKWVRSERGREALKRHLIDHVTVETISEEINLSHKQTTRVIKQAGSELYAHV